MLNDITNLPVEKLQSLASGTGDPEILLGISVLAPTKNPLRREISEAAVKLRPDYLPITKLLAIAMDGDGEETIAALIDADAENALGHYLRAHLLYQANKETESLAAFRRGAACAEMRVYGTITTNALLRALDAMGFQGRDRLEALAWVSSGMSNFFTRYLQHLRTDLSEMAHQAPPADRGEFSDLLLVAAGHLYATNFQNRTFAEWTAQAALHLKAQIAADAKSHTANGYLAILQATSAKHSSIPGLRDAREDPLAQAPFLPSRILGAFHAVEITRQGKQYHIGTVAEVPPEDQAAFDMARQKMIEAAEALIQISQDDPDNIIGAYLKDLPPAQSVGSNQPVSHITYVEILMHKRPDIFKAFAADEKAMHAFVRAGDSDPKRRGMDRLMKVSTAISWYMANNDQHLPPSLEVLYQDGKFLKDASQIHSLLTGKPFVFAAAGGKMPEKMTDREKFIVIYDYVESDDRYYFVTGSGGGQQMSAENFKKLFPAPGR